MTWVASAAWRPMSAQSPRIHPYREASQVIPIDIRYEPVEVVADTLFAYPDPYRLGRSPGEDAPRAFARAGIDTMAIARSRLRRMSRYPERSTVALLVRR